MAADDEGKGHPQHQLGEKDEDLIPGLPEHLAQICLSRVPPAQLYSVCLPWRRLLYSPSFPPFLSLYALMSSSSSSSSSTFVADQDNSNTLSFASFDPVSGAWLPLPPPPPSPPVRQVLLRHPSFISRHLPVQSVAASDHLIIVAASSGAGRLLPALSHPLAFHPLSNQWRVGPPLPTPRRWCAAGSVGGSVYVASGVGADYSADVARRVERWEVAGKRWLGGWERVAGLKDGKFSREAAEAVGLRGKLCMVNVKGNAPKEGAVYCVARDEWEEMPDGMRAGWRGPVAAMDEEVLYAVVEERGVGALMEYDPEKGDRWREMVRSEHLRGAVQVAAGGGRVCVACDDGLAIAVVDVTSQPPRVWLLRPPQFNTVIAVHVLPRMSTAPATS